LKGPGEGVLPVDKPAGVTSFSVVAAVRRRLGGIRTGHAGTLDPAASGLLVLALGNATRLLPFIPLEPKRYCFSVRFGSQTDTLDADGSVIKSGGSLPGEEPLDAVSARFTGTIQQVPPDYSAVKIGGVRAYRLARQGKRIEIAPRRVQIYSLSLLRWDRASGEASFEVSCSGGTYIRSLARDIAESLGTCGYASSVRRTAAGPFHVDRALAFGALEHAGEAVLPPSEAVGGMPRVQVTPVQRRKLEQGIDIVCEEAAPFIAGESGNRIFAFDKDDNLIAVLKKKGNGKCHPDRVFNRH
jgi:tRNA pseudouridine55 synthase